VQHPRIRPPRAAQFWTPWAADDDSRSECLIAIARAALSSSALLIVWFEPTEPARYAASALALLSVYAAFAVLMVLPIGSLPRSSPRMRVALLTCDLSFGVALTLLTRGPASPFFAFLMFAVLSAACRSGSLETLIASGVVICSLAAEAVLVGTSTPLSIGLLDGDFEPSRPIVRAIYVVIAGLLLATLAENEKQRRKEASAIASIMEQAGSGAGLEGTLEAVLGVVLRAFAADRALLVLNQTSTGRAFLWDAASVAGASDALVASCELDHEQRASYVFDVPGPVWHASRFRASDWFDLLALDAAGNRLPAVPFTLPAALLVGRRCDSALGVAVRFGEEWAGRLLLIDPAITADRQAALRLAHRLAGQIGPAAHQGYLLGTLTARAASAERGRLARELHDGVVQSLIVVEIQVEVARRRSANEAPQLADALTEIQTLLRSEIANVRDLTQRLKTAETGGGRALPGFTDLLARFERDTGIHARFFSDAGVPAMSRRSNDELSHIVQEGLANVRKHSGARHVLVRAAAADGRLKLSIEDDGRGFPFSGRLSQPELTAVRQGPVVIMERVRELGGEISVESRPGHGARVDVAVPLQ
jgi:signal transduction histidine kinase